MKKTPGVFAFLSIFLTSLVTAGPIQGVQQLADGFREVLYILIRFIGDVIWDINSFDEYLFARLLLALVIFFVVYTVLRRNQIFGSNKNITIIIAAAVTILSVKYIPTKFVEVILLQYSTFAVAITTLLPLLIFFFFIYQSGFGPFGRKTGWLVYGIILVSLYLSRGENLGEAQYVYYAGIIAVFIFIVFDKLIDAQFKQHGNNEQKKVIKDKMRSQALNEYNELKENYKKGHYAGRERFYEKRKKHWEKVIKENTV